MAFDFLKSRGVSYSDEEEKHLREAYRPEGLNSEFARNIGRDKYNQGLATNQQIVDEDFLPSQQAAQPLIGGVEAGLMRSAATLGGEQMYNQALSKALANKAQATYGRGESQLKRELEQDAPLKKAKRIDEAFGYMSHAEEVRQEEAERRQLIEDAIHGLNQQQSAARAQAIKSIFQGGGAIAGAIVGGYAGGPQGAAVGAQMGSQAGGGAGDAATGGKANYKRRQ